MKIISLAAEVRLWRFRPDLHGLFSLNEPYHELIRKEDTVEVISGDDKGTPSARRDLPGCSRVLPEGEQDPSSKGQPGPYKHLKPSAQEPARQAGSSKEMPIDVSNVHALLLGLR